MVVHFLFDDTQLFEDAFSEIRNFLKSEDEAVALKALTQVLAELLEKYGDDLRDAEYMKVPEWMNVVYYAEQALSIIKESD